MKRWTAGFCIAIVVLAGSFAHSQVTTGTISGTVTDSSGAVLPGVSVLIQNNDTGIARTVKTDAAGRYAAPSLSLGSYRISATAEGFQNEVRTGILLTVGREAVVDLRLTVGAVTQSVEVTGEAPLVQTTESTVSYLVSDRTIRDLPLNGRDLTQLVLMEPGVTQSQNSNNRTSFDGFGKRVSISGLRGEDNAYLLDGSYLNDFHRHLPSGPSGALLGAETIREFQVLTNAFGAQYGRALGGVFNAVSKSGTNDFHGDVYEFVRNSAMDAAQWEDNAFNNGEKAPFSRNQFGATLGGPIKKDKAFFWPMRACESPSRPPRSPTFPTRTRGSESCRFRRR
jgi:carboxypeptidase family protein/TonB-dependent receptor-like protein